MSISKTLGGDRVGSGKKMKVHLKNYERATFNKSSVWRSTMAPGTLVPFMVEVGLPGDTFDLDVSTQVMTHPTVGPLLGSFKLQGDVFVCPIRLYQGQLHNNKLGIGMNMNEVKLPLCRFDVNNIYLNKIDSGGYFDSLENQQFNPSSLFSYLGQRGVGRSASSQVETVEAEFNAVPYLAYWDIYKNYYANKQEEIGAFCGADLGGITLDMLSNANDDWNFDNNNLVFNQMVSDIGNANSVIHGINLDVNNIFVNVQDMGDVETYTIDKVWHVTTSGDGSQLVLGLAKAGFENYFAQRIYADTNPFEYKGVDVVTFDLSNIDDMREDILASVKNQGAFIIDENSKLPYGNLMRKFYDDNDDLWGVGAKVPLAGLALKTYQSDIFNNWLSTDWIDGDNGINALTSIDTSDGSFTIDTLTLSRKVYDMLNRIAVSGGSYRDWLEAVYTHDSLAAAESPIYMGGFSQEIIFNEVVSNTDVTTDEGRDPLGTLAGKGSTSALNGGKIRIKIDEPSYIIGIVSITPRVDYSQGNHWDMRLRTMDDFHKPALDQIGFQDLMTDQMAFWDKYHVNGQWLEFSAGKQPAWLNYMTAFNETYGEFAVKDSSMFMTLNRRYEPDVNGNISDLTTYIDPEKFNYAFAVTERSAQNFWVQIGKDLIARRKMSAKIMPNL